MATTTTHSREYYIERIERHLLKKYAGMTFKVDPVNERETYIYCYPGEPMEDTYDIIKRAGNIVTDALVDSGLRFYVMAG